jgi:hypothetical protein
MAESYEYHLERDCPFAGLRSGQSPCLPPAISRSSAVFRLPAAGFVCAVSFVLCTAVVYWAGWKTNKLLLLLMVFGTGLLSLVVWLRAIPHRAMAWRSAFWVVPYFSGLLLLSWLGGYGGRNIIGPAVELTALTILSLLTYRNSRKCRPQARQSGSFFEMAWGIVRFGSWPSRRGRRRRCRSALSLPGKPRRR